MAELHGIGVAAVLAANAQLDARAGRIALLGRDLDQLADAGLVDGGERILLHDLVLGVSTEEGAGVVAGHAEAGLREVVGAEAEELSGLGDLVGGQRAARDLDHGANGVGDLHLLLLLHQLGDLMDDLDLQIELLLEPDQRDHDLGLGLEALLGRVSRGLEDGAGLHAGDLRVLDTEAAATETEHGVELVQLMDAGHDLLDGDAQLAREIHLLLLGVRQELMQRRIEEADRGREALQRLEDAEEVFALIREELGQCGLAGLERVSEDHLAHRVNAVALEEHVLSAGETDALGSERHGLRGLLRGVGVGTHGHAGGLLAPVHQLDVVLVLLGLLGGLVAVQEA